jgi:Arc/MetJ-type ribon-helix-helix transcriptional regulator
MGKSLTARADWRSRGGSIFFPGPGVSTKACCPTTLPMPLSAEMFCHIIRYDVLSYQEVVIMTTAKIAITIEESLLHRLDLLVKSHMFPSRSRAVQEAVKEKLHKIERNRLAVECAKLNPAFEQALADEGLSTEIEAWPEY